MTRKMKSFACNRFVISMLSSLLGYLGSEYELVRDVIEVARLVVG